MQLYLDDIALKEKNDLNYIQVLRHTFYTLKQAGIKLKQEKCVLMQKAIKYLGYVFDDSNLRLDPD